MSWDFLGEFRKENFDRYCRFCFEVAVTNYWDYYSIRILSRCSNKNLSRDFSGDIIKFLGNSTRNSVRTISRSLRNFFPGISLVVLWTRISPEILRVVPWRISQCISRGMSVENHCTKLSGLKVQDRNLAGQNELLWNEAFWAHCVFDKVLGHQFPIM